MRKYFILPCIVLICCMLLPEQSMALQTHSEPEGIYVHQMAHVLYMAALGYLFWDTKRSTFAGQGWIYLRIFCVLTILWNFLALIGHASSSHLRPEDFTHVNGYLFSKVNMPLTFVKVIYYAAKLDHLLAVPAMLFLYLSLRSFYKDAVKDGDN